MRCSFVILAILASVTFSGQAMARCTGKVVRDNCDNPYCCPKGFEGSDPDPAVCTPPKGGALDCHGVSTSEDLLEEATSRNDSCGCFCRHKSNPGSVEFTGEVLPESACKSFCDNRYRGGKRKGWQFAACDMEEGG